MFSELLGRNFCIFMKEGFSKFTFLPFYIEQIIGLL